MLTFPIILYKNKCNLTINWIIEDSSSTFDTAGTANRSSNIPEFNVEGFFFWGSLLIVLNLEFNVYCDTSFTVSFSFLSFVKVS